jgi:hypothetical protein
MKNLLYHPCRCCSKVQSAAQAPVLPEHFAAKANLFFNLWLPFGGSELVLQTLKPTFLLTTLVSKPKLRAPKRRAKPRDGIAKL